MAKKRRKASNKKRPQARVNLKNVLEIIYLIVNTMYALKELFR